MLAAVLPEAAATEAAVVDTVEATEDSKEVSYSNHACSSSLLTSFPGGYGGGGGRGKHLLPITISVKI